MTEYNDYIALDFDQFLLKGPEYDTLLPNSDGTLHASSLGPGGDVEAAEEALDEAEVAVGTLTGNIEGATLRIGNYGNLVFRADEDGNHWAGHDAYSSAPFRVSNTGALYASNANIAGTITATAGYIGGWAINPTNLTGGDVVLDPTGVISVGTGDTIAVMSSVDAGYRLWAGDPVGADAPFSVTTVGVLNATGATISGTITADDGNIGGFYIEETTLASDATEADASISLDSANSLIRVGASTADYISIDGVNRIIKSSGYSSGPFGSGFYLDPDLLEVGNARIRGMIQSSTFEYETITATGGYLVIPKGADVLSSAMSASDTATIVVTDGQEFYAGDVLRMKNSTDDEWFQITDDTGAPTYVVDRDKDGQYGVDANPEWPAGTAVINYGQSGDGAVVLKGGQQPHIDVIDHEGSPWTAVNTYMRLGDLNGFLDYGTNVYGIAIGEEEKYLKYDPLNGLRIKGDKAELDVGVNGFIKGGQTDYATGDGFYLGYSGGGYKFSIGDDSQYLRWDGAQMILLGGFDSQYPISLATYATGDLPPLVADTGFNSPSSS